MRKIYLTIGCTAAALAASAQLPNPDFTDWVDCIPWTSTDNTKANGTQPKDWTISNVIGIGGLGATTVGEKVEITEGKNAVKVFNVANQFMPTQIVPGYFTLGTTWSTSVMGKENDGGTFGGIKCSTRPDAVAFSYKRSVADGSTQPATVVAYSWKGTFTQAAVPASISAFGAPKAVDMVNRDRNILGMETAKGGEVTKSEGAALVAKAIQSIVQVTEDWVDLSVPFEYELNEVPEMVNVIFAANDYFGDASVIAKDNSFTVAAPRLVYWSKLSAITIGGEALPGFSDAKYDYEVGTLPALDEVKCEVLGMAAEATVEEKEGKIVITVTNPEGVDEAGESSHTYTISVQGADVPVGESKEYKGKLTIDMNGSDITGGGMDAAVEVIPNAEGTQCTFRLPDFTLDLGDGPVNLGDIVVNDVKMTTIAGLTTYEGSVKGLKLLEGAIEADVELNGTTMENGKADMTINVTWMGMPIICKFKGEAVAGIAGVDADNASAPVMYYDMQGRRVADPSVPGLYIRRQGTQATKLLVR